jgi:hypothetical protein
MRRIILSIFVGIVFTLTVFGCAVAELIPKSVARVVLWPAFLFVYVAGAGPNIGTPERPVYEGTILDVYILVMCLGLTILFYASVSFLILKLNEQRQSRRDRHDWLG